MEQLTKILFERFDIADVLGLYKDDEANFDQRDVKNITEQISRELCKDQSLLWVSMDKNWKFDGDCFVNSSWHSEEDTKKT